MAKWFVRNQAISTIAGGLVGIAYAMHLKYRILPYAGRLWIAGIMAGAFVAGVVVPIAKNRS